MQSIDGRRTRARKSKSHSDPGQLFLVLLLSDLRRMRQLVARCSRLPEPDDDPEVWTDFVLQDPLRWKQSVAMLHFIDSVCDVRAGPDGAAVCRPFACAECGVAFETSKQYTQHRRSRYGERCPQRFYAPASGVCPACESTFGTRLALLSHLCDSRRSACWQTIVNHPGKYTKMLPQEVATLDALDRTARTAAKRLGHSHALATGGCVRKDGTPVGRPTT